MGILFGFTLYIYRPIYNTKGNIFHRSVHILGYADDVDIIARSQSALKETFTRLEESARKMNLRINEVKNKYMLLTKDNRYTATFIEIGTYKFQTVNNFIYLGSEVNSSNDIKNEIQKRILSANRCFYGLRTYLKSYLNYTEKQNMTTQKNIQKFSHG